jgi:ABC-type dipeptide/oligopeptide/nickel transport system ATPase component
MTSALAVKGLSLSVPSANGRVTVIDDLTFDIPAGRRVGLVGESGSGKSLTAYSLMRLIKEPVRIEKGEIFLGGQEILGMDMKEFRHLRGNDISMIYQDPMSALNPIMRIGAQIIESIQLHSDLKRQSNFWQAWGSQNLIVASIPTHLKCPVECCSEWL